MGIKVEYNPDLALRNIAEFKAGKRKREECIPLPLKKGKVYNFLKKEQRLYWLHGEIPLLETAGDQKLSLPIASIIILEATHILINKEVWTKGRYKIVEIFKDKQPHFNGFAKI
jgi:hypothetical protein